MNVHHICTLLLTLWTWNAYSQVDTTFAKPDLTLHTYRELNPPATALPIVYQRDSIVLNIDGKFYNTQQIDALSVKELEKLNTDIDSIYIVNDAEEVNRLGGRKAKAIIFIRTKRKQ